MLAADVDQGAVFARLFRGIEKDPVYLTCAVTDVQMKRDFEASRESDRVRRRTSSASFRS
jgi:aromatic ring hydroxylase